MSNIEFITADITTLQADAIVCPAHKHLIRGRGLSAQIYDIAGPELLEECQQVGPCKVGEAVTTSAHNLPARHIIHTVTPQWSSGDTGGCSDLELLSRCYQSVIDEALQQQCKTVIFPALGAGSNRFPHALASHQALDVLEKHRHQFDKITICLHSEEAKSIWLQTEATHYH